VTDAAEPFEKVVDVPRDRGVLDAAGDAASLDAVRQRHRMTEGPPDGIALPHADQIVDHETIADTLQQAAAQPAGARPRLAELAEDQVRRIDAGLAEDAAAAVPGARGSCSGPGRRFQVIEE